MNTPKDILATAAKRLGENAPAREIAGILRQSSDGLFTSMADSVEELASLSDVEATEKKEEIMRMMKRLQILYGGGIPS